MPNSLNGSTSAIQMSSTDICPVCEGLGSVPEIDKDRREVWALCECVRREQRKKRLKFAEVPAELQGHTIGSFDLDLYSPNSKDLAAKVKRMAANYVKDFAEYRTMGKGLYLYGSMPGSGKTRLAISIGNALWKLHGASVGFKTVINLMNEIKATWGGSGDIDKQETQEKLIASICDAEVFIFDDIGTERPTPWVEEMLFHIIDTRKTKLKPTIFTSNCEAENLCYCEKLTQRILNMAIPVQFPNESVRNSLTKSENERLQLKLLE